MNFSIMNNYLDFLDVLEEVLFYILLLIVVILFGIAFLGFDTLKCVIIFNIFFYFYSMFFFYYFMLYIFYTINILIEELMEFIIKKDEKNNN